jgi:sec-independent protein translocase protein TatB
MFEHLGWGEVLLVLVIALLVFGPDKLPKFAADAARVLRQLRRMASTATNDLREELGPELGDLQDLRDLRELHPRRLIGRTLFDDDEPHGSPDDAAVSPVLAAQGQRPAAVPLSPGESPPYDPDAT